MTTTPIQYVQVQLDSPKPELHIPAYKGIFNPETNRSDIESRQFYDASVAVIAACVDLVPVEDSKHPYHDRQHTIDVITMFAEIGLDALGDGNIHPREFMLGLIACAAHDINYDKEDRQKAGTNEKRSIEKVHSFMSEYDTFTEEDKNTVGECIDATIFEGMGDDGQILQKSSDRLLAQLVVDADVCNLAMAWDKAIIRFEAYYKELNNLSVIERLTKPYLDFLRFEVRTISAHTFKSTYARKAWATTSRGLGKNILELRKRITDLENRIPRK